MSHKGADWPGLERIEHLQDARVNALRGRPGQVRLSDQHGLDTDKTCAPALFGLPTHGERLDLAELCRQRLAALSPYARSRAIEVSFDGPQSLITSFSSAALQSVIDNLVDNAIRYTPQGGHVEVRLEERSGHVSLIVRDDGPGIPASERERVFERFVRLSAGTEAGSGLGLSIVRRILSSLSGDVQFVEGLAMGGLGLQVSLPTTSSGG